MGGRIATRILVCTLCVLTMALVASGLVLAERVLLGVTDTSQAARVLPEVAGKAIKNYHKMNVVVADVPTDKIESLRGKAGVRYVEKDAQTRKLGGNQQIMWGVEHIGASAAWLVTKGQGVKVAVLDTGIDAHIDLLVVSGYTAAGVSGDALTDTDGHGTYVAGTLAARDNDKAFVGVAPEVELYSIKVLEDTGSGTVSALIDGIDWAVQNGIQILNMSLSTPTDSAALRDACQMAYDNGLLLIAAAGNGGKHNGNQNVIQFPAAYQTVIAVGATDKMDLRASFSATGPELDIMAPGVDVTSLYPRNSWGTGSGTSIAAPHVSGVAALIWAAYPTWTNAQVQERLLSTAKPVGNNNTKQYGRGRVDAAAAVGTIAAPAQPDQTLSVVLTVTPNQVRTNDAVNIVVTVRDAASRPIDAGMVVLTAFTPSGTSYTTPGYTDANGKAIFRLRPKVKDGIGAYSLRAQVTRIGYADGVITVPSAFIVESK